MLPPPYQSLVSLQRMPAASLAKIRVKRRGLFRKLTDVAKGAVDGIFDRNNWYALVTVLRAGWNGACGMRIFGSTLLTE